MYESLKYYVLRAWALGLVDREAVAYICENAGVTAEIAEEVISRLSYEMTE